MNESSRPAALRWCRRALAALTGALITLLLAAAPGQAHSQEVASDPADRSKVSAVPSAVTITFNQNVIGLGTRVQVTGPDGDVTSGATTVTNNIVRQAISATAPAGEYSVDWHVVSADGHPLSGTFGFTATEAAGSPPLSPSPPPGNEAVTTAPAASAPASSGGSLGGLAVIGIGALVLAVLLVLGASVSAVLRSRRDRPAG